MCPITSGSFGSANSPLTMWRSVRHTAQTETLTSTCCAPGLGTGTSSRRKGSCTARSRIALTEPRPDACPSLGGDPALQRGREADLGRPQCPGDGTRLLGIFGDALEGRLIDTRHAALRAELDLGDGPAFVGLVEMDLGRGADFLRFV